MTYKEVIPMSNKQSSIEFIIKSLMSRNLYTKELLEEFEQAKAMHKQEMKDFYFKGWHRFKGNRDEDFDEYYNETYGGNNKQQ